ncbi:hypothetical protein Nepgr_029048 [Nepenthes gracilis]|uniref:Uncharacterized protein n=1 Tax=Nepenthes gracilis TaxID=150966 RepID=A0AAD3TCV6_NEPGR|nr:hypothetical protein Nepgr_029048 [Nepenthes gracilis]
MRHVGKSRELVGGLQSSGRSAEQYARPQSSTPLARIGTPSGRLVRRLVLVERIGCRGRSVGDTCHAMPGVPCLYIWRFA